MENSNIEQRKGLYIFRVVSYLLCLFPLAMFVYRATTDVFTIFLSILMALCLLLQFNSTFRGKKQTIVPMVIVWLILISEIITVLGTLLLLLNTDSLQDTSAYIYILIGIVILIVFVYATGAKRKQQNDIKDGTIRK